MLSSLNTIYFEGTGFAYMPAKSGGALVPPVRSAPPVYCVKKIGDKFFVVAAYSILKIFFFDQLEISIWVRAKMKIFIGSYE